MLRVRPITMTVAAIIAGLLPIMLGTGTGSEVMRRIVAPMVGGMASATLLTLVVIAAVLLIGRRRAVRCAAVLRPPKPSEVSGTRKGDRRHLAY